MESRIDLQEGTTVYFDRPTKPSPESLRNDLVTLLRSIDEVKEAHLVLWYVHGRMEISQPVLVIVVDPDNRKKVFDLLENELAKVLPGQTVLDVFPVSEHDAILGYIRRCGCEIYRASDWKSPGSRFVS